jgi:cytochrome b561
MIRDSASGWGSLTIVLHWVMAASILGMFALGWIAVNYPMSPAKLELFIWHKSIGLTLLALVVLRVAWRMTNQTPAPPPGISAKEHRLARTGHAILYLLMIVMPVSGYVINSTANFPFRFFGGARVPNLIPADEAWQGIAETVHFGAFCIFALVLLVHVAAALRHHFVRENDVLVNMLPGAGRRK